MNNFVVKHFHTVTPLKDSTNYLMTRKQISDKVHRYLHHQIIALFCISCMFYYMSRP
jgi:hypothetical protein